MSPKIGQRSGARSALGSLLRGVIGVMISLLVVRTWFVEPFVIPSGSMAPTLLGIHAELACRQCGYQFAYGLDHGSAGRVVCPNCGHVQIEETDPPGLNGDRVLVDRSAFRWRNPRRWEPIVFRSPSKANEFVVKRVVGLPGETIEIRDGDLYADGQLQRKTLAEQQSMAIPVYDSGFEPQRASSSERWRADDPLTGLTYHHQQLQPGSSTERIEIPVTDSCGYNQTQSRRELYPVRDLALACRLRVTGSGQIMVVATDGAFEFLVRLDFEQRKVELLRDHTAVVSAACEFPQAASGARLYVSLFDQQVTIAWNDKLFIRYPYERPERSHPASARPFRIVGKATELEILNLRIERDVYYTPPTVAARVGNSVTTSLGPDEYFVLGDNSPESHDSRWPDFGPGVKQSLLVGKPIVVYYPARIMHAWGRSFQVPEFSNIRYIR